MKTQGVSPYIYIYHEFHLYSLGFIFLQDGAYDALFQRDLLAHLERHERAEAVDVLLAADVLIYVEHLEKAPAEQVLHPSSTPVEGKYIAHPFERKRAIQD